MKCETLNGCMFLAKMLSGEGIWELRGFGRGWGGVVMSCVV